MPVPPKPTPPPLRLIREGHVPRPERASRGARPTLLERLRRVLFARELAQLDLYERALRGIASLHDVRGTDPQGIVHDAAMLAATTLRAAEEIE